MTKRKLKGPASARAKQNKVTKVSSDKNDIEEQSSAKERNNSSRKLPSSISVTSNEDDSNINIKTENINSDLDIINKMVMLEESDEEIEDDNEDLSENKKSEDNQSLVTEDSNSVTLVVQKSVGKELKSLAKVLNKKFRIQNDKISFLEEEKEEARIKLKESEVKIQSLETEKIDITAKYKKYKDMASRLKNSSSSSSVGSNKDLEEENLMLRTKLKDVMDNLRNVEESKGDVNSKLHLKDILLQKERQKYADLEFKFKNFLMKFNEKFLGKNGGSNFAENAVNTLQSALQESEVDERLSEEAKSKAQKKLEAANNTKEPVKSTSEASQPNASVESSTSSSAVDKSSVGRPRPGQASRRGRPGPLRSKNLTSEVETKKPDEALNKTLPSSTSTSASVDSSSSPSVQRRQILGVSKVSLSSNSVSKDNQDNASIKTSSPASKTLPSKLLRNSSISLGSVAVEKKPAGPVSTKLFKLANTSVSLSSSASSPAAPSLAKLSGNPGISMVKSSPSAPPVTNDSSKPGGANLLKNRGISFSKVSNNAPSPVEESSSPTSKPSSRPARSLSNLKGLNISLSKPGGHTKSPDTSVPSGNLASALVPVNTKDPVLPKPSRPRRGPASVKRKAERELQSPQHVVKAKISDDKLVEETIEDNYKEDTDEGSYPLALPDVSTEDDNLEISADLGADDLGDIETGDLFVNGSETPDDILKELNIDNSWELEKQLDNELDGLVESRQQVQTTIILNHQPSTFLFRMMKGC